MRARAAVLFAGLAVVAGCTAERLGLDGECEVDSACQELLVCADGRCRAECVEARDCPVGRLCVPSGRPGVRSCALPENPALCAHNSECPVGALCLEGRCHAECLEDRDCPAGATCVGEACDVVLTLTADAGFQPPLRDGATAPCNAGRSRCQSGCADLATSRSNCGACANACPDNERCLDGACACAAPFTACGDACVDTRSDVANCGGCGVVCTGPCSESACCGFGRARCGGTCIDVLSDDQNCGGCGVRCAEGRACQLGECAPENHLSCPTVIALRPGTRTDVRGTTVDPIYWFLSGCGEAYVPGVHYRFDLAERSLVYVRGRGRGLTFGILPGGCEAGAGAVCGVRVCAPAPMSDENDALFELGAGEHAMIVTAGNTMSVGADFSLTFEVVPVGDAVVSPLPAGAFSVTDRVAPGVGRGGTCEPGAERAFSWVACDMDTGGTLSATVAGGASLGLERGQRFGRVCAGASISASIAPGSGLHVLSIDAPDPSTPVTFDLTGMRP